VVIETAVDPGLEHGTYQDMLDRIDGYDDAAVHVRTIDGYIDDRSLVSSAGNPISFVDLTYAEDPDSSIVITAGRHSDEHGGPEAAVELVGRILASPGMQEYLRHGEITIVPAVHVDEYARPAKDRTYKLDLFGAYAVPIPPLSLRGCDGCRNTGHDSYREKGVLPDYEGKFSTFDQRFVLDDEAEHGYVRLDDEMISKEAYAVSRLLEEKKASRDEILFTADLHETDRKNFNFCTIYFDEENADVVRTINERVKKRFHWTHDDVLKDDAGTFSGFAHALGIDAYTTEGAPFKFHRRHSMAERVEQQLIALDELFENYVLKE
jgi:hypothetical protein